MLTCQSFCICICVCQKNSIVSGFAKLVYIWLISVLQFCNDNELFKGSLDIFMVWNMLLWWATTAFEYVFLVLLF